MTRTSQIGLSLTAFAALGLAAARPAAAQSSITAAGAVAYGTVFQPAYGNDGSILFDTTKSGQTAGNFVTQDTFTPPTGSATHPGATTIISQPSYISSTFGGFTVDHADGYGAADIVPGKEAGLVGYAPGDGSGNVFSFTVSTAQSFTFGVIGGFPNNILERPTDVTLTGPGSLSASDTDNRGSGRDSHYLLVQRRGRNRGRDLHTLGRSRLHLCGDV